MSRELLLTGAFQYTDKQIRAIERLGWKITFVQNELIHLDIPVKEFSAVVCNGLFLHNDIAEFKNLKMVQATSAGLERLPIEYMEKHNILYYNARGVYSIPMAEWTVMSILEIYKNAHSFFRKQQNKIWEKERSLLELTDKKVCIVGYGSVGREVARRLSAFGTEITVVNRSKIESKSIRRWVPLERIDEVIPETDIMILCIALTENTRNLFHRGRISAMKRGSVLINVARGEIVDEKALLCQLQKGKLRGAALDVFEEEPLSENSELWETPGVIVTPHNSFVGDKTGERMFERIYNSLKGFKQCSSL